MKYSQNNEEAIIIDFFKGTLGTLLDIGANDGQTLSNSRALIEMGWLALLIEASPKAYQRLKKLYRGNKRVQTMCYAVGAIDEETTFYESGEHLKRGDVALVSSMKREEVNRWGSTVDFTERIVPCFSFASILIKSRYKAFDFVTIDIEGMELEVLPQIDFDRLGTKMVCVEFNGKNENKFRSIMNEFRLIHKNAENLIFTR